MIVLLGGIVVSCGYSFVDIFLSTTAITCTPQLKFLFLMAFKVSIPDDCPHDIIALYCGPCITV